MERNINIAIFASGAGSNALKIIEYFQERSDITVKIILSSKETAGIVDIAHQHAIPCLILEKDAFFKTDKYVNILQYNEIGLIVLAGFLWKVPENLVHHFAQKIINIHPALLPKYGGKGMYGHFVHDAVILAKEKKSGITIHLVDEKYDHGVHLCQVECTIDASDTADSLAEKIHVLEHQYFPITIAKYIDDQLFRSS